MEIKIFDLPYNKKHYFKHPFDFFKDVFCNLRARRFRIKRGWCYSDLWNMDTWCCSILADMLHELSEKAHGYPGNQPFETMEQWKQWLKETSELFACGKHDWMHNNNSYKCGSKEWYARNEELAQIQRKNLDEAFARLAKYYYLLWD